MPDPEEPQDTRWPSTARVASAVAAIIATAVVGLVITQAGSRPEATPTRRAPVVSRPPSYLGAANRDTMAVAALHRQTRAIRLGSHAGYLATWDTSVGSAVRTARSTFANLAALHVVGYDTRYVGTDAGGPTPALRSRFGRRVWVADVQVGWRLRRFDPTDGQFRLRYTFVRVGRRAKVVSVTAEPRGRLPVWLTGRLTVRRTPRTLAVAGNPQDAARLSGRLQQALVDVGRVLPRWRGSLVSYLPSTDAQMGAVLGGDSGSHVDIAAVTTTVDGSGRRLAPVAIILRPSSYDRLGPVGAHVVVSHESTHVATHAASGAMPLWAAEGFADYVGVGSVRVPLSVAAGSAIREIKQHGLPRSLPTDGDFAVGRRGLEATYEKAWIANRLIAQRYGKPRLVAFFRAVQRHPLHVDAAFRTVLGTSTQAFTRAWRRDLRGVARAR